MASVDDETDLSTLTGRHYRALVEAKFQSKYGNVKWHAARLMTKDEFLKLYSDGEAPAVWNLLLGWVEYYNLEAGFKQSTPSSPPQNGECLCFCILVFKCCFYGNDFMDRFEANKPLLWQRLWR
jgi:hypothetical protein